MDTILTTLFFIVIVLAIVLLHIGCNKNIARQGHLVRRYRLYVINSKPKMIGKLYK